MIQSVIRNKKWKFDFGKMSLFDATERILLPFHLIALSQQLAEIK